MARNTTKAKLKTRDRTLFAICVVTFLIRVFYVFEVRTHPLFDNPVVDSDAFLKNATHILGGNILGDLTWQAPLYSYFLALCLFVNNSLLFVRIAQAAVGMLVCWLLYRLAEHFTDRKTALLTSLLFAIYGPLVYFDGEILATSLHILINVTMLLVLTLAISKGRLSLFLISGVMLGLSAVTRGTILLFLPVPFLWIALEWRKERGLLQMVRPCAVFLVGTLAVLSLSLVRNHLLSGETILISPGAGINFYIGNNESAWETMSIRPGAEWGLLAWEPVRMGYDTPGAQSDYFMRKSWNFISRKPVAELKLLLEKTIQFGGGEEIVRNVDLYGMRRYSWLLSVLLWKGTVKFPFGVFLPLSLAGLWLTRRRWRTQFLLCGYMISIALSNIIFFPAARYRLPMIPVLLIYSSGALVWFSDRVRDRKYRDLILPVSTVLILVVLVNVGIVARDLQTGGEEAFHIGMMLEKRRDLDGAMAAFETAVRQDPDYAEAYFFMGKIHWTRGEANLAAEDLERAVTLLPRFAEAQALLGHIHLAGREIEDALRCYENACAVKPDMTGVRFNMAQILMELGYTDRACRELETVLEEIPNHYQATFLLGVCREQQGRDDDALRFYERATSMNSSDPWPQYRAGRLLLEAGNPEEALIHLRKAQSLDPDNGEVTSLLEEAEK